MRVAFMGRSIRPRPSGVGRYAANLLGSLSQAVPARSLFAFLTQDAQLPRLPGIRPIYAPFPTPNEYARLFWEQSLVPAQVARLGIDVYHSPNYILPAALRCPSVVTIHDLAYLRRDLHRARSQWYLTVMTALAVRMATVIVAVSNYTRAAVERHYPNAVGRVAVIYEAVDPVLRRPGLEAARAFRRRLGLDFPYVLFVGTREPRKNLVRLVKAYERAIHGGLPHHLVLIGQEGWKTASLDSAIESSPHSDRIHRMGFIPDADLACWYANADLFAYPSLEEGFGLPPLEAMANGVAVITSNCSSLPEVVGDAALTVTPTDIDALSSSIERVLTEPTLAHYLREAGLQRARHFTWEDTARSYEAVYQRAAQAVRC